MKHYIRVDSALRISISKSKQKKEIFTVFPCACVLKEDPIVAKKFILVKPFTFLSQTKTALQNFLEILLDFILLSA